MKLVSNVSLKVTLLFFCMFLAGFASIAQETQKEVVQIILEGAELDSFTLEVDGNNVLINGRKPEDMGVSLNISRQQAGKNGLSSAAYGHINTLPPVEIGQPYLGIVTQEAEKGVQIIEINALGPAAKAKLRIGDKIVMIDEVRITSHKQLVDVISSKLPGDVIKVKYERGDKVNNVDVEVGSKTSAAVNKGRTNKAAVNEKPKSLGIKMRESADGKSWKVIEVLPGSTGDKAGIRVNDTILEMNGIKIDSAEDVDRVMKSSSTEQGIQVKVRRVREVMTLEIK